MAILISSNTGNYGIVIENSAFIVLYWGTAFEYVVVYTKIHTV